MPHEIPQSCSSTSEFRFNWCGVYSPCCRRCVLTRGKLVSKNAPKKGAFQNLARPAAEILSLVKQRPGKRLNQEVNKGPLAWHKNLMRPVRTPKTARQRAASLMAARHSVSGASGSLGHRTSRLSRTPSLPVVASSRPRLRFFRSLLSN
jgi:hypothetical protein